MAEVELDSDGILEILNSSKVAGAIHDLAEQIAGTVTGAVPSDAEVVVDDYRTDRAASSVTIKDVRGRVWQVRDGVLTRAASAHGLEVRERD